MEGNQEGEEQQPPPPPQEQGNDGADQEREYARQQQLLIRQHYQRMLRHPVQFGYAAVGQPSWDAQIRHNQAMAQAYGYHHLPIQHHLMEGGVPLPPGIPGLGGSTDPLESVLGPFPCVRLRNLPFDATLEDILVLFQGLVILDVLLCGQGEAFVIFANPMDFQMALQRDRQTIGRRFVDVVQGTRSEYYEAISAQMQELEPRQRTMEGGVRRGEQASSSTATTQQLSAETGMWGGSTPGLGGSVYSFQNQQQRDKGEQHQGGTADPMGGRGPIGMVSNLMGSGGGPERGLGPGIGGGRPGTGPGIKRSGGGIQVGDHTGFLRMRGLPFSSTRDDIFKFFDGYHPIIDSIVPTYRSDGRATGEAYVGFQSPDDSKKAMELHRKMMGSRYIELFISNKEEHSRAIQRFGNR